MAPAGKGTRPPHLSRRGQEPNYLITNDKPVSGGLRKLDEMSGEGDIYIVYADRRVNTGLDDRLLKNDKNR